MHDRSPASASPAPAAALQATLFDFAIMELVRQHRESFRPLWTTESWAKLLIWLALNCGCSGDPQGLEAFAAALGTDLSGRMRRVFFARELEDLNLRLMADPAEEQVLALPLEPPLDAAGGGGAGSVADRLAAALERVGLRERVVADPGGWRLQQDMAVVPWAPLPGR